MDRIWIVSQINFLAHTLHPLMAIIGIARMVVGVAAVLEQPSTQRATNKLQEELVVLHLAEGGHPSA